MTEEPEYCPECGEESLEEMIYKNTKIVKCTLCYNEVAEYIHDVCEHEYDDKNGNKCIHCGEASMHYK